MRLKRMWIVATAALVVLAGALGLALAQSGGEAEVRITAQRLEDGRTEFGLQQRIDGEWGERILPRSRFFPASPGHDRWLNSSPLTVESSASDAVATLADQLSAAQAELAETKEALEEAKSQVSLDVDELLADLEASQAEAAAAQADLTEATAELATAHEQLTEATSALSRFTAPIVRDIGEESYADGRIRTEVSHNTPFGIFEKVLISTISVQPNAGSEAGKNLVLRITCTTFGHLEVAIANLPITSSAEGSEWQVTYSLDPEPDNWTRRSGIESWPGWRDWFDDVDQLVAAPQAHGLFMSRLLQAETLDIELVGDNDSFSLIFDLTGIFETPIQPNIDHCGTYY